MARKSRVVCGVGVNDADYPLSVYQEVSGVNKRVWICPYYQKWKNMLVRCYNKISLGANPTYEGCKVSDEWLTFSNFKAWMEVQDWDGKHLDKDILVVGNKEYSEDRCVFISQELNSFMNDHKRRSGSYMVGVYLDKPSGLFKAQCCDPLTKVRKFLGYHHEEINAHLAWKAYKHSMALLLVESEDITDTRVAEALKVRYL